MDTTVIIVGLVVTVLTPLLTTFGVWLTGRATVNAAKKAAQGAEKAAEKAADAARDSAAITAQATRDVAALGAQQSADKEFLAHFRWAAEQVASEEPRKRLMGIAVLQSMLQDPNLAPTHVAAALGVVQSATAPALDRLGDSAPENVAQLPRAGEAGEAQAT
ncbi:hypothetical protein [Geodermatophilus sp. SYSU D01105]